MKRAVFFDRDGVINKAGDRYYIYRIEDFLLNEGVIEALGELQQKEFLLIIVSNQGGISKGQYDKKAVETVHQYMTDIFNKNGISITEIYYCPHHSEKETCLCRKPGSLMIEKALSRFEIDPLLSYMIGDHERDILAGQRAGLNCIKINTNENLLNCIKFIH